MSREVTKPLAEKGGQLLNDLLERVRAGIHRAAAQTHNPSPFRFLNEAEITAINSWASRGKLGEDPAVMRPVTVSGGAIGSLAIPSSSDPLGLRDLLGANPEKASTTASDPPLLLRDYLRVSYHRTQGGFTICTLSFRYAHPVRGASHEIRTGASRRSFKDRYNPIKGEMLALFRAIRAQAVTLP